MTMYQIEMKFGFMQGHYSIASGNSSDTNFGFVRTFLHTFRMIGYILIVLSFLRTIFVLLISSTFHTLIFQSLINLFSSTFYIENVFLDQD